MKKTLALVIVFAFVLGFAAPVFAGEMPKQIEKLANGTVDIIKSPLVIYDHTKHEMDSADYPAVGFLKGVVTSPFHMVKKAGHGLIDVVTFPVE